MKRTAVAARPAFEVVSGTPAQADPFAASLKRISDMMEFMSPNGPSQAARNSEVARNFECGFISDFTLEIGRELQKSAKHIGNNADNYKAWAAVLDFYAKKKPDDLYAPVGILFDCFSKHDDAGEGLLKDNASALYKKYLYRVETHQGAQNFRPGIGVANVQGGPSEVRDGMILDFANDYAGQYRTKDPRRVLAVVEQALMATCERGTPRVQSIATALKGMATHVEGKDPVAAVRARIDVLDLQPGDEQLMAQIETFASTRFKEFPDTASSALAALSQNLPKDSPEHAELAEMHLGLLAEIHLGLANLWRAQIVPEEASYRGGPLRSASDHARLYADCTADKEAAARYVLEFAREIMAYEEPFSDLTAAAEILPEGSPLRDEILQEALNLHRQSERLMIGCVTKLEKLIPEHSALSPQMKTMRQQFDREEAARTDGGVPAPTFMNMHANMLQPV